MAKVTQIEPTRGYISLSLKRVKPFIAKEKMSEFKNEKKAEKLLNFAAKDLGKSLEDAYKEAGFALMDFYGGLLYSAFEDAKENGADAIAKSGIPKPWAVKIAEIAEKNLKKKEVLKSVIFSLQTFSPDGINAIKKALDIKGKTAEGVKITYISAPNFKVDIVGADYEEVESKLKAIFKHASDIISKSGGEAKVLDANA